MWGSLAEYLIVCYVTSFILYVMVCLNEDKDPLYFYFYGHDLKLDASNDIYNTYII
jgi:hypothetical protein